MNQVLVIIVIVIVVILVVCMLKRKDSFSFPENSALFWPQFYYSFPYTHKNGGVWPSDMYNRLNYWSPGFYTGSGRMWGTRPGLGEKYWPRDRWINTPYSGDYYNIINGDDWTHRGTASYANSLFFQ